MKLPEEFTFSQGKLQDYIDCQRRFQLKYLLNHPWPAPLVNPIDDYELTTLVGQRFHQMIRQYLMGISQSRITQMIHDDKLNIWWENFLRLKSEPVEMEFIWQQNTENFPEITITAYIANLKVIAKYDLISITSDNKIIIVDWKSSVNIPTLTWLKERMQSKIYPYLLVEAGKFIHKGISIEPDAIEMIYWFANHPHQIQIFKYTSQQHLSNKHQITKLLEEIKSTQDNEFMLTTNINTCRFCVYRSLCGRGDLAGNLGDLNIFSEASDEIIDPDLTIDDISEIAF